MKKFNSILAIAAVALTSVFGFTSCDKNDDMLNQPGTTMDQPGDNGGIKDTPAQSNSTYNYILFANDNVLNLGDVKVTVEQDGQIQEYKLSDAQTATGTFKKKTKEGTVDVSLGGKMLVINNVKSGAKVAPSFDGNADAIAALQQDGHSDIVFYAGHFKNLDDGIKAMGNAFVMYGLQNVKVVDYINARTNACTKTIN